MVPDYFVNTVFWIDLVLHALKFHLVQRSVL